MQRSIVIYKDEGVGEVGLSCLQSFFANDDVRLVDAPSVIDNSAFEGCDIFVMPGGADLPYCKKLNGEGNRNIRAFVEGGGTYLGICAGAYYGCRSIEFHQGRHDEICGARELNFTDAVAYGSLQTLAPYYDLTIKSAGITRIAKDKDLVSVFYHGGPAFRLGHDGTKVLARYHDIEGHPPAVIENKVGLGRVILCGVHAEVGYTNLLHYPLENESDRPVLDQITKAMQNVGATSHDALKEFLEGN